MHSLLSFWKVKGSDLGLETGHPQFFRRFLQSLQIHSGILVGLFLNSATTASFLILSN